jgi:cell division protease FtsH
MTSKPTRMWMALGAIAAVYALAWVMSALAQARAVEELSYSAFEQALEANRFSEVEVSDRMISGRYTTPRDGRTGATAQIVQPAIADRLRQSGVVYRHVAESHWLADFASLLLGPLLFVGLWWVIARRAGGAASGGLLGVGRSRARVYMEASTGVRFADVAGVDEAKAELQELVDFLKDPKSHGRLGARLPKGVLLVGPTGTGKTLLARALAGEAGVPFFSISGSEFVEMFVGVGAARVRDLFDQARAAAPCIIFIDEIDALGKVRGAGPMFGGHEEHDQTVNQLLVELDGFDPRVGVVLLAATNRPEMLDPALLRAGRFDRQVLVDTPDRRGRSEILVVHAAKVVLAPGVDLDQIAAITVGFSGADLANLVNEAALVATRRNAEGVALADFTAAIERIVAGLEKKTRVLSAAEKRRVAQHELGHALVALALPGSDRVHKVSIVPRGMSALGYTLQRPSDDRHLQTRSELLDRLAVLLGGRAAEIVAQGEPSTGAADDLARATALARDMATRFGMDDAIGPASYVEDPRGVPVGELMLGHRPLGPATEERIDTAVVLLLQRAHERASSVLAANQPVLERCVHELLEREVLEEADLRRLTLDLRRPEAHGAEPALA